jgi:hypothetical protein
MSSSRSRSSGATTIRGSQTQGSTTSSRRSCGRSRLADCRATIARRATWPRLTTSAQPGATRPRPRRSWPAITSTPSPPIRTLQTPTPSDRWRGRPRRRRPSRGLAGSGRRGAALFRARGRPRRRWVERAALLADAWLAAHRAADTERAAAARRRDRGARGGRPQEAAARTRGLLAGALIVDNRFNDAVEGLDRACAPLPDEPLVAGLAARRARLAFLTGEYAFAREQAELALSLADRAGCAPSWPTQRTRRRPPCYTTAARSRRRRC